MGKKMKKKKHSEEKSTCEISTFKEPEVMNLESSAYLTDVETEKKQKRKNKRESTDGDCGREFEKSWIGGESNERVREANFEVVKGLVDGQDVRNGKELVNGNTKYMFEYQSKEKKKVKKEKMTMSEPRGNEGNMIESNTDNTASTGGFRAEDREVEGNVCAIESNNEGVKKRKKKNKQKKGKHGDEVMVTNSSVNVIKERAGEEQIDETIVNQIHSSRKERKRRKRRHDVGGGTAPVEAMDGLKIKSTKKAENEGDGTTNLPEKSTLKKKSKRVSFVEDVDVFPLPDGTHKGKAVREDGLVRGKRFSREEDEIIKKAVVDYIEVHRLGESGLEMVMNCRNHLQVRKCWKEIGAAIPWRPQKSVYMRAHNLFERDENRSWTPEELETLRKLRKDYDSDWKKMAEVLNKHRIHVKDTWRRICLPNMKNGKWSQEEYQNLFDLVNADLRMRAFKEKRSQHGMLRDNIAWTAISSQLQTRADPICCMKWYKQLTSPMVPEGKWLDTDDYRLVKALYDLDACCMEDVEWDNLLEHRSGDICRKRWNQMVKHLGEHASKSFPDQVDVLMQRYCPELLELREAYHSKPAVD